MTQEKKNELFLKNLENALKLEFIGVRFEEITESNDMFSKTIYKYSVPEMSIIEGEEYSADCLKKTTKNTLIDMAIEACKADGIWSDGDEEWVEEHIKCYAKVRKGEIWTEEMAKKRIEELTGQIQAAKECEEV